MSLNELDRSTHFLVVDDDAESRATMVEYLRVMGFNRVTLAHDGTEAIRFLDRDPTINFIISDWDMPLMNGLTLLQRVKHHPTRSNIPFLVVTSPISGETEKVILAGENLVDGYLIKPFRSVTLYEKIQKIISAANIGERRQALVVDDDSDARDMMSEYLEELGFSEIKLFPNGAEALEYLKKNHSIVGVIVADWEMPELNGLELLKTCKQVKELAEIPFLMVTSQTSIENMKVMEAAKAQVDQYLLKPFRVEEFKTRVESLVERYRATAKIKILVAQGLENIEKGQYKNAEVQFQEILKIDPYYEQALSGMAEIIYKTKGSQASVPYFKKLIEACPFQPAHYFKLTAIYEKLGWLDKAIALLKSAKAQINLNAELHFTLAKIYVKKNMIDEALAELEKTLEIDIDHQQAKVMLQMLALQRKEP